MRKFLLWVAIAALFLTGVALIFSSVLPRSQPAATQPELEPETAERAESPSVPTPRKKAIKVAGSVPVKLRFPSIKDGGKVVTVPVAAKCNWVEGNTIDPDRSRMDAACYAVGNGKPYVLPGTQAKDVAVIAGHTMKQVKGDKRQIAFNPLRQWARNRVMLRIGDSVEVYTKASQKVAKSCRLIYQVQKYWEVDKDKLATGKVSDEIWGKKTEVLPNMALFIGCKQRQGGPSLKNIVWRAKLVGTAGCG